MSISPTEFRVALSHWASGVTIITSRVGDRTSGMTASSFSSVSLVPPLVAAFVDRQAHTLELIAAAGVFGVSVLSHDQAALSRRFASKLDEAIRFAGVDYVDGATTRCPLLAGALVHLECRLDLSEPAGDHMYCLGEVLTARYQAGSPLLHFGSDYRELR